MEINAVALTDIILEFDRYLPRKLTLIAVGGTALTLLGKKASTRDVDFCFLDKASMRSFISLAEKLGYKRAGPNRFIGKGIAIDIYSDGYIFCVQLLNDYAKKAVKIKEMQKIDLYSLAPMDLLITKAARFNDRDKEDMLAIIQSFDVAQKELVMRWIDTMEFSLVRDAKENLSLLLDLFKEQGKSDKEALKIAERWAHE